MSGGWWGNYLWLDLASFFLGYASFFQVNRKKDARGLAQTIISGPIRGLFFSGYGTFFQVTAARQRDFTLRGRPEPRDGLPVGAPRGLPQARFGNVFPGYASVFSGQPEQERQRAGSSHYLRLDSGAFFPVTAPCSRLTGEKSEPRWRADYLSTDLGTLFSG